MTTQHEKQRVLVAGARAFPSRGPDGIPDTDATFCPDLRAAAIQVLNEAFGVVAFDLDSAGDKEGLAFLRHVRRCAPEAGLIVLVGAQHAPDVLREVEELGGRVVAKGRAASDEEEMRRAVAGSLNAPWTDGAATGAAGAGLTAFVKLARRTSLALGERDVADLLGRVGQDLVAMFEGLVTAVLVQHGAQASVTVHSAAQVPDSVLRGLETALLESCSLVTGRKPDVSEVQARVYPTESHPGGMGAFRPWFLLPARSDGELAGLLLAIGPDTGVVPAPAPGFAGLVAAHLRDTLRTFNMLQVELRRDPLTSLPDHGYLLRALPKAWARRARGTVGFLMLDVDNFKNLNDSYGHRVGDTVLVELADLVRGLCPAGCDVVRYGGDEMALILCETDAPQVRALGADLLDKVRAHVFRRSGVALRITVSIGMALSDDGGVENDTDLLELADRALYLAKRSGRNQMCSSAELARSRSAAAAPAARNQDMPYVPMRVGSGTILVVDDEAAVRQLLARMLATCQYDVLQAESAVEALQIIQSEPDRVDVLLADVRMPEMDGIELLNRARAVNPNIIAVVITGFASSETTVAAMRAGAYDLVTKPFNIHELKIILGRAVGTRYLVRQLAAYHLHTEELLREKTKALHDVVDRLRASYFKTMEAIVRLLDIHETSTAAHSRRVSEVTVLLASRMGVSNPAELEVVRFGALLHDIGKLGVPDAIINKPAALTDEEREVVRTHPELGYQMLRTIPEMENIALMVYSHHERYDGTGYPRGLKGEQTCLGARIFAVVDAYDALRHDRCYRTAQTPEKVLCEIKAGRGTQFDPAVVDAFVEHFDELEAFCLHEERLWDAGVPV